jgi:DNA-binding MurR/RpiR family transcriptional regulator
MRASYSLAYYFHYLGQMVIPNMTLIPRQMNSAIDDLNFATERDILFAITFAPYSNETINACLFARERGAKLVLLSDSAVAAPNLQADHTLVAVTLSGHHFVSYIGGMAVLEVLLAVILSKGGGEARQRIASYEKLRQQIEAYWRQSK